MEIAEIKKKEPYLHEVSRSIYIKLILIYLLNSLDII